VTNPHDIVPGVTSWNRIASAVLAVATAGSLVSACGTGGGGSGGGTRLDAALSRVADNSNTRSEVFYDDTAALVKVTGKRLTAKGYGLLVGTGASGLQPYVEVIQGQADIRLLDEQYAISAGTPPRNVGLIAGGQNTSQVTRDLTRQGWKRRGNLLVMLPLNLSNALDGATAGWLSQVQASGSDVIYGQQQADLSQAGAPAGPTLAQNSQISALANCLGDVVAAGIFSPYDRGAAVKPAVAVGVGRPASNTGVPREVVCVAWPNSGAASRYAANLRTALASGRSLAANRPWSAILRQASVTVVGGSQNLVEWRAQTPGSPLLAFQMIYDRDLPGLPDCSRLPPIARAQVPGCH
jgi:hypothetical protein